MKTPGRCVVLIAAAVVGGRASAEETGHPLTAEVREKIAKDASEVVTITMRALSTDANDIDALSKRGDAHFVLAKFPEAVADYESMVRIDPSLDPSHWRRGIAWFYAGEYEKAAKQFERYHSFDNVDRENGIWRYLCQVKQSGVKEARQGLLQYEKDDREPFPDVFKLFAGTIQPDAIRERIESAKVAEDQKEQRRFYADLYIGLNHAVEKRDAAAREALRRAVANAWASEASYGPRWMWHVGRVHFEQLDAAAEKK